MTMRSHDFPWWCRIVTMLLLFVSVASAQCTDATTYLWGESVPVVRLDGNTVKSYQHTWMEGNYAAYYYVYIQSAIFKDDNQIGNGFGPSTSGIPGGPSDSWHTRTLQTWGPGRYWGSAQHSAYNWYCQYWDPNPINTTTYYGGYMDIERPARPDYAPGLPRAVTYLGEGIDYDGAYTATTTLIPGDPNGAPGTPDWIFVAGSEFATLNCTHCNQPVFRATRAGTGCLSFDVVLKTNYDGFESEQFWITINAPHNTVAAMDSDGGVWNYTFPWGNGWKSKINYKTKSLCAFDSPMSNYSMNESFGGWAQDYSGTTAQPPSPNGFSVNGDQWFDEMGFACPAENCTPMPDNPGSAYTPVQHATQTWRVGSQTLGQGKPIQTNRHQRYTDQGEHESITTPVW